jgi:hypothetical protein
VESSLTLPDFPPGSGDPKELALQALAELLGIDKSLIVFLDNARRATTVAFRIYGSPEQIVRVTSALADPSSLATGLSAQLEASYNISVMPVVYEPKWMQDIAVRTPIGERWEEVGGQYLLRSCGEGRLLVNNTLDDQQCMPCKPMTYTLSGTFGCGATACFPRECRKCPKGATCTGEKFLNNVNGSEWEEVSAADGSGLQKRILSCPPGYTMNREPSSPEQDDCQRCGQNFYRLKPTRWQEGPNVSLPPCYACPKGAKCPGGDVVEADGGYWQLRTQSSGGYEYLDSASDVCQAEGAKEGTVCLFPAGLNLMKTWADRPMWCTRLPQVSTGLVCAREVSTQLTDRRLKASTTKANLTIKDGGGDSTEFCSTEEGNCGSARLYRCPERACSAGNACLQNRTGPLCGSCSAGFAMTTEGCSATICPSEEELRPIRAIAFSAGALMLLIIWFIVSWRPVVPEVEFAIARLLQSMTFLLAWCLCFNDAQSEGTQSASICSNFMEQIVEPFVWLGNKIQAFQSWWQGNKGGQYLKIYVTCLQILSSFNIYTVQWRAAFLACMNFVRGTVKFDFIKLPSLSCLWNGVSWTSTLYTYTLTPLALILALGIPVVTALWRGLHRTARKRWDDAVDRFYRNLIFALFILFPMLASSAMSVLNCEPNVGRLREDYRVVCPDLLSSEFIYSVVFMVLYPIGIPVFMHFCLRYMGIVKVVKEKIQHAEFHAMLSLFIKIYVSIETQRFARLVGNVDGDPKEFERQCKDQYGMLIKLQGSGSTGIDDDDGIDLMKLDRAAEGGAGTSQGMQGTSLKGIVKCLKEFDEDGNGNISGEEFQKMLITARKKANLFAGTEHDPNTINLEQLQALVFFDRWPSRHKGPQDVGESEGLGGANAVLLEREKKASAGVSELDDAERAEEEIAERAERAERQRKVDLGDIQDPTLREIHEFEQELQKRQDSGRISKKYKPCPRHAGFAKKREQGQINTAYELRFLVLSDAMLEYYEDQNAYLVDKEGGLKGSIPVREIKVTPATTSGVDNSQDGHHFTIENTSKGTMIEFTCEDAEGRDMWVQSIQACYEAADAITMTLENAWSADIREVKEMYVENPGQVNACLKRIKVEAVTADELRRSVLELAHRLVVDEVIAYPAQVWSNHFDGEEDDDKDPSPEQVIVSRFGFLFIAYRVDCWWFEGVEMSRKLLMTSVLVFIKPGTPGQMSVGSMITFFFLLLGLFWRPFCSSTLNNLNSGTLIAQFCTLFVGIMITLLDAMPAGTGQGEGDSLDRAIMAFMVVAVNGFALSWPFIHKVLSGKLAEYYEMTKDIYFWLCSKYARWCGSKEQKAQIAAADAKIKKKKQKEKQKAKEAEAASKAARVNDGAQTEATSHSELAATLGFVCERQIPEITAPAELAENTESGEASAISRPSTMNFDTNFNLMPVPTVSRNQTSFPTSAGVPLVSRDKREQTSAGGERAKLDIVCERQIPDITAPAERLRLNAVPEAQVTQPKQTGRVSAYVHPANLSDDTYYGVRRTESTVVRSTYMWEYEEYE